MSHVTNVHQMYAKKSGLRTYTLDFRHLHSHGAVQVQDIFACALSETNQQSSEYSTTLQVLGESLHQYALGSAAPSRQAKAHSQQEQDDISIDLISLTESAPAASSQPRPPSIAAPPVSKHFGSWCAFLGEHQRQK